MGRNAQAKAQVLHQCLAAQQTVGDVVAEQNAVLPHGLSMEKAIEAGNAFHMRQRKVQPISDRFQTAARKPALIRLQFAQHLHQSVRCVMMPFQQCIDVGDWMAHGNSMPPCLKC